MKKMSWFILCAFCLFSLEVGAVTARSVQTFGGSKMALSGAMSKARQGDFKTGPFVLATINDGNVPDVPDDGQPDDGQPDDGGDSDNPTVDPMLEEIARQRTVCLSNNVGISNTFVWADKNSDTSNYSYMIENVENPENNACFVRVDVRSSDERVDMSDVKSKYFVMGTDMTCGAWVDEAMLEERILDATKKGRTWGTIASVVGGAGVGVGAMELFGNKLIGGKVEGQQDKSMGEAELLLSQLRTLEKQDKPKYDEFIKKLGELKKVCDEYKNEINSDEEQMPQKCKDYKGVFSLLSDANAPAK